MTAWNCARVFSRCTAKRAWASSAGSDGQALAALGAACVDDGAAASGLHANEEAVGARAPHFGGLVGAFHVLVTGLISGEPAIIAEKSNGGNDIADFMRGLVQVRGGKQGACQVDECLIVMAKSSLWITL
jgi:hypothetical protein